jgi:hypothetical protein
VRLKAREGLDWNDFQTVTSGFNLTRTEAASLYAKYKDQALW